MYSSLLCKHLLFQTEVKPLTIGIVASTRHEQVTAARQAGLKIVRYYIVYAVLHEFCYIAHYERDIHLITDVYVHFIIFCFFCSGNSLLYGCLARKKWLEIRWEDNNWFDLTIPFPLFLIHSSRMKLWSRLHNSNRVSQNNTPAR